MGSALDRLPQPGRGRSGAFALPLGRRTLGGRRRRARRRRTQLFAPNPMRRVVTEAAPLGIRASLRVLLVHLLPERPAVARTVREAVAPTSFPRARGVRSLPRSARGAHTNGRCRFTYWFRGRRGREGGSQELGLCQLNGFRNTERRAIMEDPIRPALSAGAKIKNRLVALNTGPRPWARQPRNSRRSARLRPISCVHFVQESIT